MPKKRSRLRVLAGRMLYSTLRWLQWHGRKTSWARERRKETLAYRAFSHASPLHRPLAGVDPKLQTAKVHNLKLAVACLDGLVIRPGQTFSYWRLIGMPSARRGYQEGMILINGRPDRFTGGGLCQLSNLLYWMTLHSDLRVTERWRHSYDVFPDAGRNLPFGSGATCVYNYRDLQIRNDTVQDWQLRLQVADTQLEGSWYSQFDSGLRYRVYESRHWICQGFNGSWIRNNHIRRESSRDGLVLEDALVVENHALMMYEPLLEGLGASGQSSQS